MNGKTKELLIKIFSAVFVIAALVFNVIGLVKAVNFQKAQMIINIYALLFAIVYMIFDFKKHAAFCFKLFLFSLAAKEACALINMAVYESIDWYSFALVLVCYTCPLLLAVIKDFGKRNSIITVSIYTIIGIVCFVAGLFILPVSNPDGAALAIYNGSRILLAALLFIMIFAKYIDKAERGTK